MSEAVQTRGTNRANQYQLQDLEKHADEIKESGPLKTYYREGHILGTSMNGDVHATTPLLTELSGDS